MTSPEGKTQFMFLIYAKQNLFCKRLSIIQRFAPCSNDIIFMYIFGLSLKTIKMIIIEILNHQKLNQRIGYVHTPCINASGVDCNYMQYILG